MYPTQLNKLEIQVLLTSYYLSSSITSPSPLLGVPFSYHSFQLLFIHLAKRNRPILRCGTLAVRPLVTMVSFSNVRVTVVAVAWTLIQVALVNAQGFWFKDLALSCSTQQGFQYLGCASVSPSQTDSNAVFPYSPGNPNAVGQTIPSRSYINYNEGGTLNDTFTSHYCSDACRAHGYKYAALFGSYGCKCGMSLTRGAITITPNQANTLCNQPCPGDSGATCGAAQYAKVFVDPSFPDESTLSVPAAQQNGWQKLGCFRTPNFDTIEPAVIDATTASSSTCLNMCADYGYSMARMVYINST